jgi:hypothetical protein
MITYFVLLPFERNGDGELVAGAAMEVKTAESARNQAKHLTEKRVGAVVFSRTGDPAAGEFDDAIILASYGDVPDDFRAHVNVVDISAKR